MAAAAVAAAGDGEDPRATTIVQVAAGEAHSLALAASGNIYAWGRGLFGRQGSGVLQDEHLPTLVEISSEESDDEPRSSISDGYSLSTRDDARQREREREREIERANRSIFKQVAAGSYHSLALACDGTVWSWGFNAYGQLGRETAASFPAPVAFPARSFASLDDTRKSGNLRKGNHEGKRTKILLVDAGGMVSSAIDQEGGLWLWGQVPPPSCDRETPDSSPNNEESTSFSLTNIEKPERVRALMGYKVYRVACGNEHIVALVEGRDGADCYSWGSNSYGQLGLGDKEPRSMPTFVRALAASQVGTIMDIACGAFHSAVISAKDDDPSLDYMPEPVAAPMHRKMQPSPQLLAQMVGSPKLRGRQVPEQYIESPKLRSRPGERYPGAYPYPGVQHNNGFGNFGGYSGAYSDSSSSPKLSSRGSSQVSINGGRMQGRRENVGIDGRVSICWTFGQGENGQLGHGSTANQNIPTAVDGLPSRERLRTVVCGLFHSGAVTETGDVWVWGMEGGLGLCPGIGPPGAKSGDALIPVRVFGESSAKCNPVTGSKGIACGAAHTITVSNNGKDIWGWGRGQSGVLGLGHASDSWFPSRVLWPPGPKPGGSKESQQPEMEPMFERKSTSRGSSRTGDSKGRRDDVRPYNVKDPVEDIRLLGNESNSRKLPVDYNRPSRRGDDVRPTHREQEDQRFAQRPEHEDSRFPQKGYEDPRFAQIRDAYEESRFVQKGQEDPRITQVRDYEDLRFPNRDTEDQPKLRSRGSAMEATSMSMNGNHENGETQADELSSLKAELAECRRFAETLHAAIYGGLDNFPYEQLRDGAFDEVDSLQGHGNGQAAKNTSLQDWQRCIELAADQELVQLELFYKGMRNRIKDVMFQRRMEDWCRCYLSALSTNQFQEPPPVRDPFSAQSTPSIDGPGEFAMRMSGILADRGEMLPPAALAASLAEFRMLSQRRR